MAIPLSAVSTNAWVLTAFSKGTLNATLSFNKMENLTGGSGNDTFAFQPGGSLCGTIDGGTGIDTITGPDSGGTWVLIRRGARHAQQHDFPQSPGESNRWLGQ